MSEQAKLPVPAEAAANGMTFQYVPTPEDEDQGGGGLAIRRYLSVMWRYKWLVLALLVAGTAGGWYAGRFAALSYRAQATVILGGATRQDLAQGPIQSGGLLTGEDWLSLLRSFEVLDHVAWEERLYLEHATADTAILRDFALDTLFAPGSYRLRVSRDGGRMELLTKEGVQVESAARGSSIGAARGFRWHPPAAELTPGRTVDFTVVTPREAAVELNRRLGANLPRLSSFIAINYQSTNPQRAASVVNTTVTRFIDVSTRLKNAKTFELQQLLEQQLVRAEMNLLVADQSLQAYRAQTITLPREGSPLAMTPGLVQTQTPVTNVYWQMKMQRDALERDRTQIVAALDAGRRDSLSVDALSLVPSVQQSPELNTALAQLATERAGMRALRQQFTDEHAQVVQARERLVALETRTIPELAGRVLENVGGQLEDLDRLIAAAGTEMQDIPVRVAEEWKLQREQASAERLYTDVRQRFETTRLATDATVPDLRVLDNATAPNRPVSDPRIKMLLAGVALSLALGMGVAFLLDLMDPRLRYVDQVTRGLKLQVVGAVPNLSAARRGLLASPGSSKVVLEALRAVRLGLAHAHGAAGPIIVTISSPGSGDGKTFISGNLGLTFASLGHRVLIIDGDTRRGDLHRLFGVTRRPGLTDYLAGSIELGELVKPTGHDGLSIITGGARRDRAPELLSSPRMGSLMAAMKAEYDVILLDSPPLGAGVDPLVLGTLSGSMLLVMRTGTTERAIAQQKLEIVGRLPIRVLGAVLNGFDSSEGNRYYSYMPDYETQDEPEAESEKLLAPARS